MYHIGQRMNTARKTNGSLNHKMMKSDVKWYNAMPTASLSDYGKNTTPNYNQLHQYYKHTLSLSLLVHIKHCCLTRINSHSLQHSHTEYDMRWWFRKPFMWPVGWTQRFWVQFSIRNPTCRHPWARFPTPSCWLASKLTVWAFCKCLNSK